MKVAELKWLQFRQRLVDWQNEQITARSNKIERAEERSISILQKRYGFTREQATSELHKHYSKAYLG